jgi:hypothetical protein
MSRMAQFLRCSFAIAWLSFGLSGCGQPQNPPPSQQAPSEVQLKQSPSDMSITTANRFHLALLARIAKVFAGDTQLGIQYVGILALDDGRRSGQRIHGGIGAPYTWAIIGSDGESVLDITVSLEAGPKHDVIANVGNEKLYVHVSRIVAEEPSRAEMEKRRDNLGGVSIQELLLNLREPAEGELEG